MKINSILFFTLLIFTTLFSGCTKNRDQNVTVERDCTGTYLRLGGKDYHVCNPEKLSSISDGASVTAIFKKINDCNGSAKDAIVCQMLHENEGWIEVEKIK